MIADPGPAAYLSSHLRVPVIPFELTAEGLAPRIDRALQDGDAVALFPMAGVASPSLVRALQRRTGTVHVFPWDGHAHMRELLARARRIGVKTVLGGGSLVALAEQAGLKTLSIYEEPDETDGTISRMVVRAAAQAVPRLVSRHEERLAYGLILKKTCQGAIGSHDSALCVDGRGLVSAAFAHPCHDTGGPGALPALPRGVPVTEALRDSLERFTGHAERASAPLHLDVYSLAEAGGEGCVVVLRGERRRGAGPPGRGTGGARDRVEPLLRRVDALLERTDALTRARRARHAPRRFPASLRGRTVLLDWSRVRFFELRSGLVYAARATGETCATNYTLADIVARVDARDFFRIHRNVIVNLNYVKYVTEIERHGVSRLRVLIEGPDAPSFVVSRPASAALRKLLED